MQEAGIVNGVCVTNQFKLLTKIFQSAQSTILKTRIDTVTDIRWINVAKESHGYPRYGVGDNGTGVFDRK